MRRQKVDALTDRFAVDCHRCIRYQALIQACENCIRLETLTPANDRVSNAIAALPITRHYDLSEMVHSSSDGQKFETRRSTFNARHGPKYFGLKKGIVVDTLLINHIPVNATVIGANEHESHYVFDLLVNNTTSIRPDVHSTHTYGTNEVNFALLHVFGFQFAPRYADLPGRVRTALYGFQHPSQYAHLTLRPIRKQPPSRMCIPPTRGMGPIQYRLTLPERERGPVAPAERGLVDVRREG